MRKRGGAQDDALGRGAAAMTESRECPDFQSLAAYVEGRVGRQERREIERHLASCEECAHVVAETIRYREEQGLAAAARPGRTRVVWAAAAAILLAVTVLWQFGPWRPGATPRGPVRGVDPLIAALAERRFVDARVSGGFSWAPLAPLDRSADGPRSTPSWEVLAAASAIKKQADAAPTTENLHALGIAHFVLGDLDEAVSVLRRVSQGSQAKAKPLSDLGAALLDRGERKGRPDDLVEALDCIEKSLQADPNLGEALFNHAVAFEKLKLNDRAEAAWATYLAGTTEPGWHEEAQRRLDRLKAGRSSGAWERDRKGIEDAVARGDRGLAAELVARHTQESRQWLEEELLGTWEDAEAAGRGPESARALGLADAVAEGLFARTGDPMSRDVLAFARQQASRQDASDGFRTIVRGRTAYRSGLAHYAKYQIGEARPLLADASAVMASIGDPLAPAAEYAVARCDYYDGALDRATRRVDGVIPVAERNAYAALAAHAHWLRGLLDVVGDRLGESLAHYQSSLATFQRLGEDEHVAFVSSLLAEDLGLLGDERECLRLDLDAVSRLDRVRTAGWAVAILEQTAMDVLRQGYPGVALEFQNAAVARAQEGGDAVDATDSLLRRAPIAFAANHPEVAADDVDASRLWMGRVTDASLRRRLEAEVRFTEGRVARAGRQPRAAVAVLNDAVEFFKAEGREARLPELLLERARALRASGDAPAAESDLTAGIDVIEAHRADVLEAGLRVSYFDTSRELFDELVGLQYAGGRPDAALASLGRGKTKDLLDRMSRAPGADAAKATDRLPTGVVVIAYGVLPDRLLIWTLAGGARHLAERPVHADEITGFVDRFRDDLSRAKDDVESESGAQLRELLLDPVASSFGGAQTVVFVPDGVLHAVPFAALKDPRSGRFLVEERSILVAPSIEVFLRASRRTAAFDAGGVPTLLAMGDPAFDASAFPYLSRLSNADDEVEAIAKLYADPVVYVGGEATRAKFLEAMERASVVHLAAHALVNETDPMRSRLLLAANPEQHDDGVLLAGDLYARRFDSVRLVVLAACATASGRLSRSEGPLSLARPFLAGGVPDVVATLWDIEDASSSALLVRFHREIAAGHAPEEALRDAQVALIGGPDAALRSPRIWAAFELVGGSQSRPVTEERKEG